MDGEKDLPGHKSLPTNASGENTSEITQNPAHGGGHRIQFTPTAKPGRGRPVTGKEDGLTFVAPITRRSQSVASIPQVISKEDKDRRESEKEEEKKNVNIDEHLMVHQDVAERYKTRINMEKPEESFGLTGQQAEKLLHEHGPNVLTPPKKRHPFLKYLDCLSSLFNLLLILAGILEYILLGINFKDNFQNVSVISMSWRMTCCSRVHLLIYILDLYGSHPYCGCAHQRVYRILPAAKIAGTFGIIPQYDSSKVYVSSRWQVGTAGGFFLDW